MLSRFAVAFLPAVSALSFTCHFNLLPIRASLRDPSRDNMLRVIQLALAVCVAIYATVAVSGECAPPCMPWSLQLVVCAAVCAVVAVSR